MVTVRRLMNNVEVNESYFKFTMNYTGSLKATWKPVMTADTTNFEYWMHWQVFLCAIWILLAMFLASVLILKYDASHKLRGQESDSDREMDDCLYADESWRPCLKEIHPAALLIFRVVAFCLMASLLSINIILDGPDMFYFYTQWTFTLVTVYFGLGSVLSMYGCYLTFRKGANYTDLFKVDTERGSYLPPAGGHNGSMAASSDHRERSREKAGIWGHIFQVMFQTSAGAVLLTDCVFWFIIFPFLTARDYSLNFLMVSMHSVNLVLLLIDTSVNRMRFPWYRIAYFMLWTSVYVIFQWVIHASVSLWWPYPILDLSSSWAPLWYLFVALLHVPCYALFAFIIKAKHHFFARWFPQSYQCSK